MPIGFLSCKPKKPKHGASERWQEPPPASPQPPSMAAAREEVRPPDGTWNVKDCTPLGQLSIATGTPNIEAYAPNVEISGQRDPSKKPSPNAQRPAAAARKSERKVGASVAAAAAAPAVPEVRSNPSLLLHKSLSKKNSSLIGKPTESSNSAVRKLDSKPQLDDKPQVVEAWRDQPLDDDEPTEKSEKDETKSVLSNSGRADIYHRKFANSQTGRKASGVGLASKKSLQKTSSREAALVARELAALTILMAEQNAAAAEQQQKRKTRTKARVNASREQPPVYKTFQPDEQYEITDTKSTAAIQPGNRRRRKRLEALQSVYDVAVNEAAVPGYSNKNLAVQQQPKRQQSIAPPPPPAPQKIIKPKVNNLAVPPPTATPAAAPAAAGDRKQQRSSNNSHHQQQIKQQQQLPDSASAQLAITPLTRRSSERRKSDGSQVYRYPSFSGRSSADCEYIEVMGAKKPPVETPLTRAIFDNAEHADLIDQVDKATGGPHNYRADQELENIYGLRVKKFWDRYQLHGTPYLDHLRIDPEYNRMPPHTRLKTKQLHANNEHLCQHLYHIKQHPVTIDNSTPQGFGRVVNVEAKFRAKRWRLYTEINYKLFLRILRALPMSVRPDELLREAVERLRCQMFLAKLPATSKRFERRYERDKRCIDDANYSRDGPPWWRALSDKEQNILDDLLQAQADGDDDKFCSTMQRFGIHFERFQLQEALDMCNGGRGVGNVGDVVDPLELLYYMRMTSVVRDAPYAIRSFLQVGIVLNTSQAQIDDVRQTMKTLFDARRIKQAKHKEEQQMKKHPGQSRHVYARLRDIRDAMKIYPSPYSHINIRWLMYNSKLADEYAASGPYNIRQNLCDFTRWAASKHYVITKLPDFGRLPMFHKYYTKALDKFRPPEAAFLNSH